MIVGVTAVSLVAFTTDEPIRYTVFPALIWAAFRFGPPGATLSIAITAGMAIGETADDLGPFAEQPIDHRTLSTQLYIWVAALTTLFISGVVSERERSSRDLVLSAGSSLLRGEGVIALVANPGGDGVGGRDHAQ
jgi:integral membrane sensor domain MASE1